MSLHPLMLVSCHSCGEAVHAQHHSGLCSMCDNEREFCCECWDAEDTSCRIQDECNFEPEVTA